MLKERRNKREKYFGTKCQQVKMKTFRENKLKEVFNYQKKPNTKS